MCYSQGAAENFEKTFAYIEKVATTKVESDGVKLMEELRE
jgi:hypothetical protein